jgi:hypothetical protein
MLGFFEMSKFAPIAQVSQGKHDGYARGTLIPIRHISSPCLQYLVDSHPPALTALMDNVMLASGAVIASTPPHTRKVPDGLTVASPRFHCMSAAQIVTLAPPAARGNTHMLQDVASRGSLEVFEQEPVAAAHQAQYADGQLNDLALHRHPQAVPAPNSACAKVMKQGTGCLRAAKPQPSTQGCGHSEHHLPSEHRCCNTGHTTGAYRIAMKQSSAQGATLLCSTVATCMSALSMSPQHAC